MALTLFTYARSVSAHRVRIALNLKGVAYHSVYLNPNLDAPIETQHLALTEKYWQLNPQGLIPALLIENGNQPDWLITQSGAILEFLEEYYPERALLPTDIRARAEIRSFAQVLIADTQPLNVMRVYQHLAQNIGVDYAARREFYEHWAHMGFAALEDILEKRNKKTAFCFGEQPSLADVCLAPQVYNAQMNRLELGLYPNIRQIYNRCLTLSAFQAAQPETQRDWQTDVAARKAK